MAWHLVSLLFMCKVQSAEPSEEQRGRGGERGGGVYLGDSRWVVDAVQVGMRQAGLGSGTLLGWHVQQGPAHKAVA